MLLISVYLELHLMFDAKDSIIYFSVFRSSIETTSAFYNQVHAKQELSSDWSIYLSVLHMIGQSKMNERSPDMTPNRMLLDISVWSNKTQKHLILINPPTYLKSLTTFITKCCIEYTLSE
jgi:hypothetical protein